MQHHSNQWTRFFYVVVGLLLVQWTFAGEFSKKQSEFKRVQSSLSRVDSVWKSRFQKIPVNYPPKQLFIRIFKLEQTVEAWVSNGPDSIYHLAASWPMTGFSGTLGPKNKQGDFQIPEGFYKVVIFNPTSNYHLSLGLNYPNQDDRKRSKAKNLGGDIFIHGTSATIGCIPIGNLAIEELYWLAALARDHSKEIPVHIFPFRMTPAQLNQQIQSVGDNQELVDFWQGLVPIYNAFESTHKITGTKKQSK